MSTTSTIEIEVAAVSHEDTKATDSKEENGPKHFPLEPLEITEPSVAEHDADTEYPSGVKFWGIFIALCFTLILAGLDGAILATAVPAITDHFHTVADIGWYAAAYKLCACAFQFAFGKLYHLFPIKIILMISVAFFLLGSILSATAVTSTMLVAGRAVAGLGSAGCGAGAFTIISQIMPLRKRPAFLGMLGLIEGAAAIVAPIIGGALTETLSWRWCFYINLPIECLALAAIALLFTNPRRSSGQDMTFKQKLDQMDLVGNLLFLPSITCLFIILSWAGIKYAWSDPKVIGLFVIFGVFLLGFLYNEYRRGDKATLPPRIIKQRSVIAGFIFISCMSGAMSVVEFYLPTYFQAVRGYGPATSGYLLLPIILSFLIAVTIQGAATSIIGYYTPFMILASVLAPVAAGLMTTLELDSSLVQTLVYSGLTGLAAGLGYQGPQNAVQCALSTTDAPMGVSIILFAQHFGSALYVALAQTLFSNLLSKNLQSLNPDLTPRTIENMGIMELKNSFGHKDLHQVILGFDESLTRTWYLVVGLTCATMVGSLATEWKSVKQKKN